MCHGHLRFLVGSAGKSNADLKVCKLTWDSAGSAFALRYMQHEMVYRDARRVVMGHAALHLWLLRVQKPH
jgi:hypothetical protein